MIRCAPLISIVARLGWSGMTLAIDGRADVPLRHLSQGIDPCLGYSVGGLGRQRPVPDAIPTKSVAAGLYSERLLGLLENPRVGDPPALVKQTDCSCAGFQLRHEYRPVGKRTD